MDGLIRRYPLVSYFVISYAGTWLVWALFVLSRDGSGLLPFHSPVSFLVLIGIGTFWAHRERVCRNGRHGGHESGPISCLPRK